MEIIEQAALGEEDTFIATRYLLDGIPQIEIAEELGDKFENPITEAQFPEDCPGLFTK